MGVEQVCGAVQADGGLAGAGGALHAHGVGEGGADEVVLLGLDGRGDVPHGPDAGPLDLAGHDVAGAGFAPAQVLVLQAGEVGGVAPAAGRPAEPAPDRHALGVAGARLVEGAGDGGPPVDHERRCGRVLGDPHPADVVALPAVRGVAVGEVEPAEEQRARREFAHGLGLAAQPVAEDFGVGAGGGDVLSDDDLFGGALDHRGEGRTAGVVVGALGVQGVLEGGVE